MVNRQTLCVILAALVVVGCKDKSGEGQQETQAAGEGTEAETTTGIAEVQPPIDAAPIAKLSELPSSIFLAHDSSTQLLHWQVQGEDIAIRAEATAMPNEKAADLRYDLKLFASLTGVEEAEFFECKGLRALASAKADLVLRGDMLHVLCINAAVSEDPGTTDGGRFALDLGKRALVPKGTYGGDGSLDLDTIDLDEGE